VDKKMQIGGINSKNPQAIRIKSTSPDNSEIKDSISLGNSEETINMPLDLKKLTTLKSSGSEIMESNVLQRGDILGGALLAGATVGVGLLGGLPRVGIAFITAGMALAGGVVLKDHPDITIGMLTGTCIGTGLGSISGPTGALIGAGVGAGIGSLAGLGGGALFREMNGVKKRQTLFR